MKGNINNINENIENKYINDYIDLKENTKKVLFKVLLEIAHQKGLDENLVTKDVESFIQKGNEKEGSDISIALFKLASIIKDSPATLAKEVAEKINAEDLKKLGFNEVKVAGPYVNIKFNKEIVFKNVITNIYAKGDMIGYDAKNNDKTVLVEYSSPNIAKQFHIGHLKTTIIGAMLYNLHKAKGYNTIGINHLGDYGTQFGKLIEGYLLWKDEYNFSEKPLEALNEIYIRINEACSNDEKILEKCRENFKLLEEKDPKMVEIWTMFTEVSLKEFNKIYNLLGVKFDSLRGESAYQDKIGTIVSDLESKGIIEESEGAKIVNLEEFNLPPVLIQKSNGSSLYITRDILTFLYRTETYNFDKLLYVVASEQALHFRQLFKLMQKYGVDQKFIDGAKHISYGMVSLPTGKMSTRLGNVVKIEDLLKDSVAKVYEKLNQRDNLTDQEKQDIAMKVGVGAVIFSNLSTQLIKDQVFVLENVLDFTGDTGPYVQYVNVRINSILKEYQKSEYVKEDEVLKLYEQKDINKLNEMIFGYLQNENFKALLNQKEVYNLFNQLGDFENILTEIEQKHEPYILTSYLINLSKAFNQYYNLNKILTNDKEKRILGILICKTVTLILTKGMSILGIQMPEKM